MFTADDLRLIRKQIGEMVERETTKRQSLITSLQQTYSPELTDKIVFSISSGVYPEELISRHIEKSEGIKYRVNLFKKKS